MCLSVLKCEISNGKFTPKINFKNEFKKKSILFTSFINGIEFGQ